MKRGIAFVLALIMVLSVFTTAFAEGNYDKELEKAITKSKKLFNIGSEYDKFNHSVDYYNEDVIFYLNWSDSKEKLGSVNVGITSDGTVVNYNVWKPIYGASKPALPKISKNEGLKIAEDFIKKVSPEFVNNIKYVDRGGPIDLGSEIYNYNFVRIVNNIPFYEDTIDIGVNKATGEVINYYTNWNLNIKFPEPNNIIDKNQAKKLYAEKIGLDLIYKSTYKKDKPKYFLAYSPMNENLGIDARNGDVKYYYDYDKGYLGMGGESTKDAAVAEELSPEETKAVDTMKDIISKAEAEKISREYFNLDAEYKLYNSNLYPGYNDGSYTWHIYFTKGEDDERVSINLDAKTKELQSFYNWGKESQGEAKYSKEECQKIAEEFVKKHSPEKYELMELEREYVKTDENKKNKMNLFNFLRKTDKAYIIDDGARVLVDGTSGKIVEYYLNWGKGELPPSDNIIPKEKALEILFKDVDIELKYIYTNRYNRTSEEKPEITLVYGLKTQKPSNIDANTGQILDYNGEPYKERKVISYTDIDNSYAKEKINILAEFGIALPGDEFRPDDKINQRDFLYLLIKAKEPYYYYDIDNSDDNLYNSAIRLGIIKEEERDAEKILTREMGTKYIINTLGYGKVAELLDIYKDIFKDKDIDQNLKGHISIAYGLKIVNGNNGYFKPKGELKREDAIIMIYNMLFN
ncbi:MAG: hypothetical protein GX968_07960 [Tissierellia bacterium]|nr:hypothetical protein [Tissierellia bacterium]